VISDFLNRNKIKAEYYHAGLDSKMRSQVQERWMKQEVRVMVATNAFGMGIDKNNVRAVIHFDLPDSPEAYFQEAGRAGRDEQKAYAVLLYNQSDIDTLEENIHKSFPEVEEVKRVYKAIANYFQVPVGSGSGVSYDFRINEFALEYNLNPILGHYCLKVLELQGLISVSDSFDLNSRIHVLINHNELYEFQVRNPSLDHFIKTIIRSHGGVFDRYVEADEKDLSIRAGVNEEEIISGLQRLDAMKIISYVPASDDPQLVFLTERLDERDIRIDRQHLAERKERQVKRMYAMIDYATKITRCRSELLLHYFGEDISHRCGNCDYCTRRNKLEVSDLEFTGVYAQVRAILAEHPHDLQDVIQRIEDFKEDKTTKVVEWLIDNNKIRFAEGNLLEWVE